MERLSQAIISYFCLPTGNTKIRYLGNRLTVDCEINSKRYSAVRTTTQYTVTSINQISGFF